MPRAEKAIEKGNPKEVIDVIVHTVEEELQRRFKRAMEKKKYDVNKVDAAREYVQAMLGFVLYSHRLYENIKGGEKHGEEGMSEHKH